MDIIKKSWDTQHEIENRVKNIGHGKYGRVLKMARKPTSDEYSKTSKITGLGILLLGGLGFTIWWLWTKIPKYLAGLR